MTALRITALLAEGSPSRLQHLLGSTPEEAAPWVRVIARDGVPDAQVCYGRMLLEGTGTPKNQRDAFLWFQRAARQGNADALNMLGRCFEHGWGVEIDLVAAASSYQRAADAGHAWAEYNLGHLYLDGRGVGRSMARAYTYYRRAAAQNHSRAMNLVGRCCEQGWGTAPDISAAANWYRRSAEAGYFRGQYNWASVLLAAGRATEAVVWFERAVEGGTPEVRDAVLAVVAAAAVGGSALHAFADRLRAAIAPIGP